MRFQIVLQSPTQNFKFKFEFPEYRFERDEGAAGTLSSVSIFNPNFMKCGRDM